MADTRDALDPAAMRAAALARFEAIHAEDPANQASRYHATLRGWVDRLLPERGDALVLAAAAQHLGRFRTPRSAFPEGLEGYKKWRSTLARKHAEEAAAILEAVGYDAATRERVVELITKKRLGRDPEVGAFEDAICLTFLELEFEAFAARTERDKVVDVVRKTWAKMAARGREEAARLLPAFSADLRAIVEEAIRT
ncbi:MAG: DUF4202 domain-containing protein [Polyangiaceae bacterium]